MPAPILQIDSISKRFGATNALREVCLEAFPGEVLALIGENGAGKSTLMKVLSGVHRPDRGQMLLDSQPFAPRGPQSARNAGVAMIYQELNLAPDLSVADNVMLGRELQRFGWLQRKQQYQHIREAFQNTWLWRLEPRYARQSLIGRNVSIG